MGIRLRRLACSFCGRGEKDVEKLVAGPRVYICDRCAAAVIDIMNASDAAPPRPAQAAPTWFARVRRRVREVARTYRRLDMTAVT
jgi:ATP-dependent protease Clp ATPase subunit